MLYVYFSGEDGENMISVDDRESIIGMAVDLGCDLEEAEKLADWAESAEAGDEYEEDMIPSYKVFVGMD